MTRRTRLVLVAGGVCVLIALAAYVYARGHGFSARGTPGGVETTVARTMRGLAIPAKARDMTNPVASTEEGFREALAHFADHCAFCHGNDGAGQTDFGRGLYPKPPDMRLAATQKLTDGELFYIIENGVPLTGMPAFGTGTKDGEAASWQLVHFIRRLPKLTAEELEHMAELNPISADEWLQRLEEQEFLRGGEAPPPRKPAHEHKHGGH